MLPIVLLMMIKTEQNETSILRLKVKWLIGTKNQVSPDISLKALRIQKAGQNVRIPLP